jgi:hypothetical protein
MVNPGKFWVREVPMDKTEQIEVKGVHSEVAAFERGLSKRYNAEDPKAMPLDGVENPKIDMLVAVRPDHNSKQWFRGKIINIGNQPEKSQTLVKVFLIDYGLLLDDINLQICVRVLPRVMTFTKGIAKIVNLAGIRPLTVSVDFHLGMEFAQSHQEMTNNWSTYSQDFMRNVLDQSSHKLAILRDWRLDAKKKVHGDLILLGFTHKISLCKLLVTTGHGDFFPNLLKTDLEARTKIRIGPKFTSIVAPGATPGTRTLESEMNFSIMSEEQLEAAYVQTPFPDEEEPPLLEEEDFQPFLFKTRMERTIRRNTKKKAWENKCQTNIALTDEEIANGALQADGEMPFIDWDLIRSAYTTEYIDSEEEEEDREIRLDRQAKRKEYENRSLPLPAGIDIGRFMEDSLKRMPQPALGPKQIRVDLLTNTDPNLAENYHDDDQYFDAEHLPDKMSNLTIS